MRSPTLGLLCSVASLAASAPHVRFTELAPEHEGRKADLADLIGGISDVLNGLAGTGAGGAGGDGDGSPPDDANGISSAFKNMIAPGCEKTNFCGPSYCAGKGGKQGDDPSSDLYYYPEDKCVADGAWDRVQPKGQGQDLVADTCCRHHDKCCAIPNCILKTGQFKGLNAKRQCNPDAVACTDTCQETVPAAGAAPTTRGGSDGEKAGGGSSLGGSSSGGGGGIRSTTQTFHFGFGPHKRSGGKSSTAQGLSCCNTVHQGLSLAPLMGIECCGTKCEEAAECDAGEEALAYQYIGELGHHYNLPLALATSSTTNARLKTTAPAAAADDDDPARF